MSKTVVRVPFYRLKHCQTVAANGKTVSDGTVFAPFFASKTVFRTVSDVVCDIYAVNGHQWLAE